LEEGEKVVQGNRGRGESFSNEKGFSSEILGKKGVGRYCKRGGGVGNTRGFLEKVEEPSSGGREPIAKDTGSGRSKKAGPSFRRVFQKKKKNGLLPLEKPGGGASRTFCRKKWLFEKREVFLLLS